MTSRRFFAIALLATSTCAVGAATTRTARADEPSPERLKSAAEEYDKGRRALGDSDPDVLVWINNLAGLLEAQAKFAESEALYRESVDKHRRVRGEEHPTTLQAISALGASLIRQGRWADAQPAYFNAVAADDIKVLVTGNPANTNALIAMKNAPDIPTERFNALTRLDHNRAISQLAAKAGVPVTAVKQMTIWGNHSATQYPDVFNAEVNGQNAAALIDDQAWIENDFIPTVAKRGAAIIAARGSSSAASAANATIEHMRDWVLGSPAGDWISAAVPSDGSYGVPEGIISSFPVITSGGTWTIVQDLDVNDFSRARIDASVAELQDEAAAVTELGLI